jgi:hypothetical protein
MNEVKNDGPHDHQTLNLNQHELVGGKPLNTIGQTVDADGPIELLRLRLEGVYEDIKGVLSTPNRDPGAESSRRLYFAATAIGRVVEYLSEPESGEANAA